MGAFEGLRVEPSGAIVAYLPAGVVRLEPDETDAGRAAGWYDWSWREVEDPTEEAGNELNAKLDAAKVSKASVNYEELGPTARRCALCTMFIPPAACSHVAGEISPDGTCEDFEMKLDDAKLDEALRRADAMAKKDATFSYHAGGFKVGSGEHASLKEAGEYARKKYGPRAYAMDKDENRSHPYE